MKLILRVLFATALTISPLLAGVVYEIEVTNHDRSPPKSESIQATVEGRSLKMGIPLGGRGSQGDMIFRGDRREIMVVDHKKRTYLVMDAETIERLGQVDSQIQEALKNVPEGQRAMVEKMMRQRMPKQPPKRPQSELRRTSERATHNGYPCVKYEVLQSGRKIRELWVTDWSNVEGGSNVAGAFEEMADFFREMMDAMPNAGGLAASGIDQNVFEHQKELDGFPVVTRDLNDDGTLERETVLRSAKRQRIDPDAFEPPSGYKRQKML